MQKSELCTDDGSILPESRSWAEKKHKKIKYYFQLFATSMKNKWQTRVYIDLFSSAGKSKIKENGEIVPGSPLLALDIKDRFDNYIFVEKEKEYYEALKSRVMYLFPQQNCVFINGDCNIEIKKVISSVPKFTKENNGLSLCFADPYNANQLHFNTIKEIANSLYVDFLILIPSYMDINRNERLYTREEDETLDLFLGTKLWRADWANQKKQYETFGLFIADYFCKQMKTLGYIYETLSDMELIKMGINQNLPLYHISFFSRNKLGYKFWKDTIKNTTEQIPLCFDQDE